MKLDTIVDGLVSQFLINAGGRDGEAMHFHFDISLDNYRNSGKSFHSRKDLQLLYYVRSGCRWVDVFSAITDNSFGIASTWEHEVYHDSCWRNIRAFNKIYMELSGEVNAQRVEAGLKEMAPNQMSQHVSFRLFNGVFNWVPAKVVKDKEDPLKHRKFIKLL
jgi:hypothetical protein